MDTPIGQFVLIGNFRRRLARELLVVVFEKPCWIKAAFCRILPRISEMVFRNGV